MPVVTCLNGHEIELQADQYGQRIACPLCQLLMIVSPPRPGEALLPKYEVLCDNKHVLRVKSKYLGTQIRCPQCQGLAWVTTDRLQRNLPLPTAVEPIIPVVLAETIGSRTAAPVVAKVAEIPIATTLDDIPIAELDGSVKGSRKSSRKPVDSENDDEDEQESDGKLTKAGRRQLRFTDQGLGFFLGSVIGYCVISMISALLLLVIQLISQSISTPEGAQGFVTFLKVISWIIFILFALNTLLYLAGNILTLFTPLVTGATVWFILAMILSAGFVVWRLVQLIWSSGAVGLFQMMRLDSKLEYFLHHTLLLLFWVAMILGLWQLAMFARKPVTRQRIILLGLLGIICWIVIVGFPLLGEAIGTTSRAISWMLTIFWVLLNLGAGLALIFQHLKVVNDVRDVMYRRS